MPLVLHPLRAPCGVYQIIVSYDQKGLDIYLGLSWRLTPRVRDHLAIAPPEGSHRSGCIQLMCHLQQHTHQYYIPSTSSYRAVRATSSRIEARVCPFLTVIPTALRQSVYSAPSLAGDTLIPKRSDCLIFPAEGGRPHIAGGRPSAYRETTSRCPSYS